MTRLRMTADFSTSSVEAILTNSKTKSPEFQHVSIPLEGFIGHPDEIAQK